MTLSNAFCLSTMILVIFSSNSFALGPIPNGTYKGAQKCTPHQGDSFETPVVITVTDASLNWDKTTKEFTVFENGFFKFTHYSTESGSKVAKGLGHGYFTELGLHFRAMIDLGFVVEGEDTFFVKEDSLFLISSAAGYKCEGEFKKQ